MCVCVVGGVSILLCLFSKLYFSYLYFNNISLSLGPPPEPPEFILGYPICKSYYTELFECEFRPTISVKYCSKESLPPPPTISTTTTTTQQTTTTPTSTPQEISTTPVTTTTITTPQPTTTPTSETTTTLPTSTLKITTTVPPSTTPKQKSKFNFKFNYLI